MKNETAKQIETILKALQTKNGTTIFKYEINVLPENDYEIVVFLMSSAYRHELNALMYLLDNLTNCCTSQNDRLRRLGDWLIY